MHALGHGKSLLAALDGAWSRNNCQPCAADRGRRARKSNDCVVFLKIAAHQFVGLRNLDDFLHARHFFQRALLHFTLVSGDADGGALRARHGVCAIAQLLDFFANAPHLLFGSVRFHDD